MHLTPDLKKRYTREQLSAREAQRLAQYIAWGPMIFQVSRLMIKFGILEKLGATNEGLTRPELVAATQLSDYAVKVLLEGSLSIGTVKVDDTTDRYTLTKAGWFLLNDASTRVNVDFNHDVNYEGLFNLEEALLEGKPAGLRHFGSWPTVYEGLSSLPEQVQKSWFGFDHFYSDHSFPEALRIIFGEKGESKGLGCRTLLDVGGNTGKWAMQCVNYDEEVEVTIVDLPQQLAMMRQQTAGRPGADRVSGYGMNLLDTASSFPTDRHYDIIWMSQFLDCFSMDEIVGILSRAAKIMDEGTSLCIMETLWDRQKYETSALCLTMTSIYFTDIANGNSKMYNTEDMQQCIEKAGLYIEQIFDNLGTGGHSILVCKKANK